jgi:hypothetical protein
MSLPTILQHLSEYDTALVANTIPYLDPTPNHEWYMGSSIASITPGPGPTVGVAGVSALLAEYGFSAPAWTKPRR